VEIREDQAWLLQSRINPLPVAGSLVMENNRISFRLNSMAEEASLGWLQDELGIADIKATLQGGEQVIAFDYPLDGCAVTWPITGGGAVMIVQAPGGRKWVVSYDYPGTSLSQTFSLFTGRKKARRWKLALADAEAEAEAGAASA
jgi:hypothetical protein